MTVALGADGDVNDDCFIVVVERKVERCKVVELLNARRESTGLKNPFSMGLLLSEANSFNFVHGLAGSR